MKEVSHTRPPKPEEKIVSEQDGLTGERTYYPLLGPGDFDETAPRGYQAAFRDSARDRVFACVEPL